MAKELDDRLHVSGGVKNKGSSFSCQGEIVVRKPAQRGDANFGKSPERGSLSHDPSLVRASEVSEASTTRAKRATTPTNSTKFVQRNLTLPHYRYNAGNFEERPDNTLDVAFGSSDGSGNKSVFSSSSKKLTNKTKFSSSSGGGGSNTKSKSFFGKKRKTPSASSVQQQKLKPPPSPQPPPPTTDDSRRQQQEQLLSQFSPPKQATDNFVVEENHVKTLSSMGFNTASIMKALKNHSNNIELAMNELIS